MFVRFNINKKQLKLIIEKYPDFIDNYKEFNPKYEDGQKIAFTKKLYEYMVLKYDDIKNYFDENLKKDDTKLKEYNNEYVKNRYKTDEEYKKKMYVRKYKSYNKLKDIKNDIINNINKSVNIDKKYYILAIVYLNRLLLKLNDGVLKDLILEIKIKTMENEDNIDELFNIKDLHIEINKKYSFILGDDWETFKSNIQKYRFNNIDNCKTTKFNYVLINGMTKSLIPNKDIKEFEDNGNDIIILSEYP